LKLHRCDPSLQIENKQREEAAAQACLWGSSSIQAKQSRRLWWYTFECMVWYSFLGMMMFWNEETVGQQNPRNLRVCQEDFQTAYCAVCFLENFSGGIRVSFRMEWLQ